MPQSLGEAVDLCIKKFDKEALDEIKSCPKDELSQFHFDYGMQIRNELIYELKNFALLKAIGFIHEDDVSGIILAAIRAKLNGEEFTYRG